MKTISISKLKAHLSAELKKVRDGQRLIVLDHKHPIAELRPLERSDEMEKGSLTIRRATQVFSYSPKKPKISSSSLDALNYEREDRW